MDKNEFKDFMFNEFPTAFETSFAREMLENILYYAESLGDETEQYNFLTNMIPQVSDYELRKVFL